MRQIKKGNLVIVRSGKDKKKTGKVLEVFPEKNSALVEGVNLATKHRRRRKQEEPSGIVKVELPINLSKLILYCPKCKKGVKAKIDKTEKKEKKILQRVSEYIVIKLNKAGAIHESPDIKKTISVKRAICELPLQKGSVKNKMKENERNHREHRGKLNSLCSQKEFPLKDITEKIIGCAIEVHSTLGPGLLINFNVERLKDGIKRLIL